MEYIPQGVHVISLEEMIKLSVIRTVSIPAEPCDVKMETAGRRLSWFPIKGACKSPPEGVFVLVGLSVGEAREDERCVCASHTYRHFETVVVLQSIEG